MIATHLWNSLEMDFVNYYKPIKNFKIEIPGIFFGSLFYIRRESIEMLIKKIFAGFLGLCKENSVSGHN